VLHLTYGGSGRSARRRALAPALFLVSVAAAGFALEAQSRRPMSLVDLAEVPRILDVQLSPDGAFVLYTLTRPDWKLNRAVGHLWKQPVAGGAPTQLTYGDAGEQLGRWAPDGRSILFIAARGDLGPQIHVLPTNGGEARPLSRHAAPVSQPAWAPDGSAVYFVAAEPRTAEERERERVRDDVFAFEENLKQRHLWKVNVADGSEHRITDGPYSVLSYRVSRDGRRIVMQRAPSPLVEDALRSEVWLMDANGANARAITSNELEESEAELSPDNQQVLFITDASAQLEPYHAAALFVVPASGGTPRLVLPEFPHAIERATWGADGRTVLAVVNMGVRSEVFRIDVNARTAKRLTNGDHSIPVWHVSPSARSMVLQFDEETRLGDAWTLPLDPPPNARPVRVTGIYDSLAREFHLPRQEMITWKGADGAAIEGLLFYPIAYEPGRRYPLLVQLHGGPHESDKFGYGPGFVENYLPVLAAKGYLVLRPNYRGSSGYGSAFLRDVVGGYFNNMHLDVLAGVDALVARGLADADRLGVMGWSAGGHLTNKLISVTDRFKAASSTAGAANWTSFYAQSDTRSNRTPWFGGTPWQPGVFTAYWNQSPLKDAARVKTPTLFITGEEDARVPMMQSVEMFRALQAHKVPTHLLVAPREGHQWVELRHRLAKANAELEWFERHLMQRSHTRERAPGDPPPR
jgi:dipeptidyl aminopeptidase/acylaminoacyl peptidase